MLLKAEISCFVLLSICNSYFGIKIGENCFCKLKGEIDDCTCSIDTVDYYNNVKIYPRLKSILTNDYFRFYKVNLKRDCPFWVDDSSCGMKDCHIQHCDDIPAVLKAGNYNEAPSDKYLKDKQNCNNDHNDQLSYLNTTISAESYKEFELWKVHDDAQDNFCVEQEDNDDVEYVDLLLNPERYTGYKGESAHRIWKSIYEENCFRPNNDITTYIGISNLKGMCLEKRVFYRAVSGLHASINVHLCADYLLSETKKNLNFVATKNQWGPNLEEFKRRFDPNYTNGEGPHWLRNLYFLYLLELRALAKASPYLQHEQFFSGNDSTDEDMRILISELLMIIRDFHSHIDESKMFNGGFQAKQLKEEFRQHFRNISRIMDCVGCDKCKLWGKLQTQGLGTALKILFSGKFDGIKPNAMVLDMSNNKFRLQRDEIVALFNSFGRLSTSIYQIEQFRQMFT